MSVPQEKLNTILKTLEEGLQKQEKAYRDMLELSRNQKNILDSDSLEELDRLVSRKQDALDRIENAEKKVVPILKRWQELKSEFEDDDVRHIEDRFQTVRSLLAEIIEQENELEEMASSMMSDTSEEIENLIKARDAQEEYGSS